MCAPKVSSLELTNAYTFIRKLLEEGEDTHLVAAGMVRMMVSG